MTARAASCGITVKLPESQTEIKQMPFQLIQRKSEDCLLSQFHPIYYISDRAERLAAQLGIRWDRINNLKAQSSSKQTVHMRVHVNQ